MFVLWVGWAPVLVAWGGFAVPEIKLFAVDPFKPWMVAGGSVSGIRIAFLSDELMPEDVCRRMLRDSTTNMKQEYSNRGNKPPKPTFQMVALSHEAREEVGMRLAESPWLKAALKRGPVNAIPMPKHIKSVQMALA
jgi:hypothetical protein